MTTKMTGCSSRLSHERIVICDSNSLGLKIHPNVRGPIVVGSIEMLVSYLLTQAERNVSRKCIAH